MSALANKILVITFLFLAMLGFSTNPFPGSYKRFLEEDDCDACGCSSGGGSLGMGGVIENNFLGVRFLHQKYQSKDGIYDNSPKINEFFNTIQLWSRIPIFKQIELQVFVPYHYHYRTYVDKTTNIKGFGDITVLSNYTLFDNRNGKYNKKNDKISVVNHLVKLGFGVKLPTGAYDQEINNTTNPSFQLGTGSLDYITNLQYVFKYNNLGITNYLNYYYKNTNKKKYRFGNQVNFNSTFFYVLKDNKQNVFVPSVGVLGEFYQKNKQFGLTVKNTDGYAFYSNVGVEYNAKKITFGASGVYPLSQNLAQGQVKAKYRTSVYLNYNF